MYYVLLSNTVNFTFYYKAIKHNNYSFVVVTDRKAGTFECEVDRNRDFLTAQKMAEGYTANP